MQQPGSRTGPTQSAVLTDLSNRWLLCSSRGKIWKLLVQPSIWVWSQVLETLGTYLTALALIHYLFISFFKKRYNNCRVFVFLFNQSNSLFYLLHSYSALNLWFSSNATLHWAALLAKLTMLSFYFQQCRLNIYLYLPQSTCSVIAHS